MALLTLYSERKIADKAYKLVDGGGLYIEVAPSGASGGGISIDMMGKESRISLGAYPDVTFRYCVRST